MRLYRLDGSRVFSGESKDCSRKCGRPQGWIRTDLEPPTEEGKVAQWLGDRWRLIDPIEPAPIPEPTPVPEPQVLTVLQLRRLFTFEEKVACEEAILNGNSALKVFMDDLAVATEVDLSDLLVSQGLGVLVASEILTEERKQQILNNEAPEVES